MTVVTSPHPAELRTLLPLAPASFARCELAARNPAGNASLLVFLSLVNGLCLCGPRNQT
jgi:hypothetical protein